MTVDVGPLELDPEFASLVLRGIDVDDEGIAHPGSLATRERAQLGALDETDYGVSDRAEWQRDPVRWALGRAQVECLWSKQREILEAVRDHRRVAVHSCHNVGKTYTAALATGWWIDTHPPGTAFVLTTAPTGPQVKALLWREINRLHSRAGLPGRVNLTEWYLGNELVAFGRKPSEYNQAAFQGVHDLYVLVILDEACGIPTSLWVAAESIASNVGGHILAIGNPDVNDGDFFRKCQPDSGWRTIHIGYSDTPNFTDEPVSERLRSILISEVWVEQVRKDWMEDSALFQSKALGLFPSADTDPWITVPLRTVTPCRYLELPEGEPVEGGIDVGADGDRTVIFERRGARAGRWFEFLNPDPMATVGQLVELINEWGLTRVKVDVIGIGWGIYGRLKELSGRQNPTGDGVHRAEVVAVNVAEQALNPKRFLNKRAELWWSARERSRLGSWDLSTLDNKAVSELTTPKYEIVDSYGKIKIEPKKEVRKRLGRSPDVADALLLAFYEGAVTGPAEVGAVRTFARANLMSGGNGSSPFGGGSPIRTNGSVFNGVRPVLPSR